MLITLANLTTGAADLIAALLFMLGLKRMSSPATARSGINTAGVGMLVVILANLMAVFTVDASAKPHLLTNTILAVIALAVGGSIAWRRGSAASVTQMPQTVALFNGLGGGAAGAIAASELYGNNTHGTAQLVLALFGGLIGAISFSGSTIAWAKLDGVMKKPLRFSGQRFLNAAVLLVAFIVAGYIVFLKNGGGAALMPMPTLLCILFGLTLLVGIMVTLPIGGADMPVVISIYNAATGLAVGFDGYVIQNPALMIAGMVVGAAGTLLTLLMAKAMNRSVTNVLFSNFGDVSKATQGSMKGTEKPVQASDAGIFMRYASSVIVIPGYGLAEAQAQVKLYEFVKLLLGAKINVRFAIHPVAGRMPGQMDVLLAEAGVPYNLIFQMDDINADFANTDVALVIGANDVVNPAARTDKSSPIYGMPILNADKAKKVYVVKRGQGKGYSGVDNQLFYDDNTFMVYGDAKAVLAQMIEAVRGLGVAAA